MLNVRVYFCGLLLVIIFSCQSDKSKAESRLVKLHKSNSSKSSTSKKNNLQGVAIKPSVGAANVSTSGKPKISIPAFNWQDELRAVDEVSDFDIFLKSIYGKDDELDKVVENKEFFVNYEAIKLDKFIKLIARVLKFDYLLHREVKGTVTINLQNDIKLTNKQLWVVLDYILSINGAYISIGSNRVVNILPLKQFDKQLSIVFNNPNSNITLHDFRLYHTKSGDVIKLLKSIFKTAISIIEAPNKRDVLVISNNENIAKVGKVIVEIDKKKDKGWSQQILYCENVLPSLLAKELATIMEVLGFPVVTKHRDNDGQKISLIPLDRHQVIIISSPNFETIEYVKKWLEQIDYQKEQTQEQLFTYSVRYSNAAILIESINTFFNQTVSVSPSSSSSGSANGTITDRAGGNGALSSSSSRDADASGSVFSDKIVLYEDQRINRIILKCRPRTFTLVKTLLDILDAPPLQALVRVTAVDIQLNDDLQYGFSYAANQQFGNDRDTIQSAVGSSIAAGALQVTTTGNAPSSGLGLLFQRAGVDDEFGFIRAVANNTETRLLNTPEILVQNLKTASIQIGSDVPYSAGVQQNNNSTIVQNIQYRDTGVLLEVTPDIGLDGYISLNVKQEISSIADSTVAGIQSPTFNKSLIETSLTLKDGETFLIGGIITTRNSNTEDGVPFLKDIPFIGGLFKSKNSGTRKSELVILVTVRSVRGQNEADEILLRYHNSIKELKSKNIKDFVNE